jgi:fatty-acyl-CoA synthase
VAVRLDAGTRRERFAVVVESRHAADAEKVKVLRKEVGARVFEAVNARPSAVLVLPAGTLPKTPSGKLRRAAAGEQLAESIKEAS